MRVVCTRVFYVCGCMQVPLCCASCSCWRGRGGAHLQGQEEAAHSLCYLLTPGTSAVCLDCPLCECFVVWLRRAKAQAGKAGRRFVLTASNVGETDSQTVHNWLTKCTCLHFVTFCTHITTYRACCTIAQPGDKL